MGRRYNAVYHGIIHTAVIWPFFHIKQKFNIPLRPFDGREIQPRAGKPVFARKPAGSAKHLPVRGSLAHHAFLAHLFPAGFKLRFYQADTLRPAGRNGLCHRKNVAQRDKRDIHTEKLDIVLQHLACDMANIGALHIHHALITPQFPGKLPIAHIHRIHLLRAVLQHAVGKAAGGCTNVHAHLACRGKRKHLHRLLQLQPAPAYIGNIVPPHLYAGPFAHRGAGLIHFLFVHEHHAGHNQRLGAFAAGHKAVLAKVLIQPKFHIHSSFSTRSSPCASSPRA